jgi:TRAP-type mannitol/chloroaromatic compound transport system permease small subunit
MFYKYGDQGWAFNFCYEGTFMFDRKATLQYSSTLYIQVIISSYDQFGKNMKVVYLLLHLFIVPACAAIGYCKYQNLSSSIS